MPPILVLNPRDDLDFVSAAEACVAAGAASPLELQEFLRSRFPHAVVRSRELSGETTTIWYVYRDGHWISGHAGPPEGG